jgi:gliding motility-associated protein GldM
MAGGKESPRQKMIGMMYLVLTALLALNISKDILDAFVRINQSLETTSSGSMTKNQLMYAEFDKQRGIDPEKVQPYWEKAQKAKAQCESTYQFIETLKKKIIAETEGVSTTVADTIKLANVDSKDNYDIPTHVLFGASEDGSGGDALLLKQKIDSFRIALSMLLPEETGNNKIIGLETEEYITDEGKSSWVIHHFYNSPMAATLTTLSKLQNDIRNAEFNVINTLYTNVKKDDFTFDTIAAKVVAPTNYVLQDEDYKAEIFLAAYSTTQQPQILINNNEVPVSNGMGQYIIKASTEGVHEYSGNIQLQAPNGSIKNYPFKSDYIVAKPTLVVSPTKMNVLYIGPENPISISVPGIPSEFIQATISGGNTLQKVSNGEYVARLSKHSPPNVEIAVSAKMPTGEIKTFGVFKLRAKIMPNPYPCFVKYSKEGRKEVIKSGSKIQKSTLMSQSALFAEFEPNFDFKMNVEIVSFDVSIIKSSQALPEIPSSGKRLSEEILKVFEKTEKGSKIIIEHIKAKDEVGNSYNLPSMTLEVLK